MKKIVIAGGTGSLGNAVVKRYYNITTEVVALSRTPKLADKNVRYIP